MPSKSKASAAAKESWVSASDFEKFIIEHSGHPAEIQVGGSKARTGTIVVVAGPNTTIEWATGSQRKVPTALIRFVSMNDSEDICGQRI